jgi:acetyltransferase-like isoleucine patch superfamily enzyme
MKSDLSYYNDKFPYNKDVNINIDGIVSTVGKHTYGVELIKRFHYDKNASFHIGRFCAIAHTEFYLGGSKDTQLITSSFTTMLATKFFSNTNVELDCNEIKNNVKNNIYIHNDVWIGNNSTIMHGVKVGNGAVIAANSHVVNDVPAYSIYGGNPARLIKYRFDSAIRKLLLDLSWWEFEDDVINTLIPQLTKVPSVALLEALIFKVNDLPRSKCSFEIDK